MLQNLKNKIKGKKSIYMFLLTLLYPYRKYLDSRQRKIYEAWNRKNENIVNNEKMRNNPLISIVVPTYNTPIEYLRDMIQSVENQSYTNWELIIVDDASPNSDVRDEISNISKDNIKIKDFFLKKNRHIAGATNYGIEKAKGEYIGLLDHDDILHKDALLSVVEKINEVSGVKFLYTDEIKLDENGRQYQPFFKPDWNGDFLRSINYITHFAVIQREFLIKLKCEDGNYNGTQDWELFLRITRNLQPNHIVHIPKILYYWRVHKNSTAMDLDAKPYVVEAQKKALEDDVRLRKVKARVIRDPMYGAQWYLQYYTHKGVSLSNVLFDSTKNIGDVLDKEPSDVVIFSEKPINCINFRDAMGDVLRKDIGAVIPKIMDEEKVINNLISILDKRIVECIHMLNRRSFTRHIYLTSKYNLSEAYAPIIFVEGKKLNLINRSTRMDSESITAALCNKEMRTLYNPYIIIGEKDDSKN